MSDENKGMGFGSILLIVTGAVAATGIGASAVTHCADQKTERARISFKETELWCKTQERIEELKAKFHKE